MTAVTPSLTVAPLATLADAATGYAVAAKAPATLRGYSSDWRQFSGWCADRGLDPLPAAPEVVAGTWPTGPGCWPSPRYSGT